MHRAMTDDDVFRLLLLGIFLVFVPFAILHRVFSVTDEKLDRWQEGAFILFGLRLGAVPWFVGSLVWPLLRCDFDSRAGLPDTSRHRG